MIDLVSKLISEGRGSELMAREANQDSPVTAYRFHSLCAYMGDDDMYSSDLSDDQLKQRLGHMCNTPCQVIYSMVDEYVPDNVDKKALAQRLCKAMGGTEKVEIEWETIRYPIEKPILGAKRKMVQSSFSHVQHFTLSFQLVY